MVENQRVRYSRRPGYLISRKKTCINVIRDFVRTKWHLVLFIDGNLTLSFCDEGNLIAWMCFVHSIFTTKKYRRIYFKYQSVILTMYLPQGTGRHKQLCSIMNYTSWNWIRVSCWAEFTLDRWLEALNSQTVTEDSPPQLQLAVKIR